MKKKLFEVQVMHKLYVLAEDRTEAEAIADRVIQVEESCFPPSYVRTREVEKDTLVDPLWLDSLPFDGDGSNQRLMRDLVSEIKGLLK